MGKKAAFESIILLFFIDENNATYNYKLIPHVWFALLLLLLKMLNALMSLNYSTIQTSHFSLFQRMQFWYWKNPCLFREHPVICSQWSNETVMCDVMDVPLHPSSPPHEPTRIYVVHHLFMCLTQTHAA